MAFLKYTIVRLPMDNSNDPNNPNQPSVPNPLSTPDLNQAGFPQQENINPPATPLPDSETISGTQPPIETATESPWPISSAPNNPFPQDQIVPTQNAADSAVPNPFLQPQSPVPQSPTGISTEIPPAASSQNAPGLTSVPATENMFQTNQVPSQDPLNTAFTPGSNPNEANPFGPSTPLQTPTTSPTPEPVQGEAQNPATQQPPGGTLDFLSPQTNNNPAPVAPAGAVDQQPGNPLPETGPVENAPTDLSHLIAGDEEHQQPGDIYNPPVVSDHNPAVTQPQTPTEPGGGEPPHGKHLNLTKILLVVGIPIILIVAALSAYLILGIGKTAPEPENTPASLPVETQQAPLTNPPQKITAPSPSPSQALLPSPSTTPSTGSATLPIASGSPAASLSPAMQAAQRQASPSPAALASISP